MVCKGNQSPHETVCKGRDLLETYSSEKAMNLAFHNRSKLGDGGGGGGGVGRGLGGWEGGWVGVGRGGWV